MLKRNLWKLIASLALIGWAVAQLIPVQDEPFVSYVRTHVTAKQADFAKLLDEAAARKKNLQAPSEFVALKQIGKERRLDLTQYFPEIRLEESLKNIEKRNDVRGRYMDELRKSLTRNSATGGLEVDPTRDL